MKNYRKGETKVAEINVEGKRGNRTKKKRETKSIFDYR
jgi:hypothetical protein